MKIYLYQIDDAYIDYLRSFDSRVNYTKKNHRKHIRKYIGAVLLINDCKYFAPLSSPKPKDYDENGFIRKDPIFLTRIVIKNENGKDELKGKILLGNMIPIPDKAAHKYNPADEKNQNYRTLVIKELDFITKNRKEIMRKANIIYKQKTGTYFNNHPKYLDSVVDFLLLEDKCKDY